ncbi:hypothetical protein V5O48_017711 [Marasmius crinis-equi]|uniref:Uncharacterized protein n=1 Tax=Marasmius crinis-equi TaxID=585013 RepID=A0ABR3EN78_9AGAR
MSANKLNKEITAHLVTIRAQQGLPPHTTFAKPQNKVMFGPNLANGAKSGVTSVADHLFPMLGSVHFWDPSANAARYYSQIPLHALENDVKLLGLLRKRAALNSNSTASSQSSSTATASPLCDLHSRLERQYRGAVDIINNTREGGVLQLDPVTQHLVEWPHPTANVNGKQVPQTQTQLTASIKNGQTKLPNCAIHRRPMVFQTSCRFQDGRYAAIRCVEKDCFMKFKVYSNSRKKQAAGEIEAELSAESPVSATIPGEFKSPRQRASSLNILTGTSKLGYSVPGSQATRLLSPFDEARYIRSLSPPDSELFPADLHTIPPASRLLEGKDVIEGRTPSRKRKHGHPPARKMGEDVIELSDDEDRHVAKKKKSLAGSSSKRMVIVIEDSDDDEAVSRPDAKGKQRG